MSSDAVVGVPESAVGSLDGLVRPRGGEPAGASWGRESTSSAEQALLACRAARAFERRRVAVLRTVLSLTHVVLAALAVSWAEATGAHTGAVAIAAGLWLVVEARELWHHQSVAGLLRQRRLVRRGCALALAITAAGVLLNRVTAARESLLAVAVIVTAAALVRWGLRIPAVFQRLRLHRVRNTVVVVGDVPAVRRLLTTNAATGGVVVGSFVTGPIAPGADCAGVPVLGAVTEMPSLLRELRPSQVFVVPGETVDGHMITELQWALAGTRTEVLLTTPLTDTSPHRVQPRRTGSHTALSLRATPPSGAARAAKSVIERAAAVPLLLALSPLLLALMLIVRLDSHGPAIFKQTRVREGGRTFTMLKLRTMEPDAEGRKEDLAALNESDGGHFKIRDDPRITRSGRIMRKLSLDELPQLVNVVRGDMALIGPRPPLPKEVAEYDERAMRRLAVKPGLTGLWQVSGRSDLCWEDTVRIDIDYVDNWTPERDLSIAARTIGAVARRKGAY